MDTYGEWQSKHQLNPPRIPTEAAPSLTDKRAARRITRQCVLCGPPRQAPTRSPLHGATSVPDTDTASESGSQSALLALPSPRNVPIWNDLAPCPGYNRPVPATPEEWRVLLYPDTTHHSSQTEDSFVSAADALTCFICWRNAMRPSFCE